MNKRRYWSGKKGEGETLRWLQERVNYSGESCLIWPFFRDSGVGRGRVQYKGRLCWANRVMCELVHGDPPTPRHQAAHNCGNGHEGCVHPQHLEWKTSAANALDRAIHGTNPRPGRRRRKLTPAQVEEIRRMKGHKTQMELARIFGVSDNAIRNIHAGRTWGPPKPKREAPLTPLEVAEIKSLKAAGKLLNREIAERYNITPGFVSQIFYGKWNPKAACSA